MVALNSATSPFLKLPSELRLMIYRELLTTTSAITLYHDQTGRDPSLGLCPTILRVSRQIYNESVWLLYEYNVFIISLTTEIVQTCGHYYSPPSEHQWHQRAGLPTPRKPDIFRIKDDSTGEEQGLIYPHCIRRCRHMSIVTAGDAVRGLKQVMPFFSDTYDLIIRILECLAADDGFEWALGAFEPSFAKPEREKRAQEANEPLPHRKTLDFVLLRHEKITTSNFSCKLEEMNIMANLLVEVERKRDVASQNMNECMRDVERCQVEYRLDLERVREFLQFDLAMRRS